jgi:antitoxin VapB
VVSERHVKLFKNGRNQAVRIPREFELPGEDAIMRKEGERLIIEPAPPKSLLTCSIPTSSPISSAILTAERPSTSRGSARRRSAPASSLPQNYVTEPQKRARRDWRDSSRRCWSCSTCSLSRHPPIVFMARSAPGSSRPAGRLAATTCSLPLRPWHSAIRSSRTTRRSSSGSRGCFARTGCGEHDQPRPQNLHTEQMRRVRPWRRPSNWRQPSTPLGDQRFDRNAQGPREGIERRNAAPSHVRLRIAVPCVSLRSVTIARISRIEARYRACILARSPRSYLGLTHRIRDRSWQLAKQR